MCATTCVYMYSIIWKRSPTSQVEWDESEQHMVREMNSVDRMREAGAEVLWAGGVRQEEEEAGAVGGED